MVSEIQTRFCYKMAMALTSLLFVSPEAFAYLQQAKYIAVSLNPGTVLNAVEDAGSLGQCVLRCLQQSCDSAASPCCTLFCWSETSLACYVQTTSLPYKQLLPSVVDSRCFVRENMACPVALGYQLIRARCVKVYEEKKEVSDARTRCAADGGHLYYFKTLDTEEQVIHDVTSNLVAPSGRYMIGATKTQDDNSYRWGDGTVLPLSDEVWLTGEPNGAGPLMCADVVTRALNEPWMQSTPATTLARMVDDQCGGMGDFICQVDV